MVEQLVARMVGMMAEKMAVQLVVKWVDLMAHSMVALKAEW